MVVEVRLGQSVLYRGHGTSCPEVQVEDSRQDDDLHISREVTSTRATGRGMEPVSDEIQKRGGGPTVLLPWLRNWPAAFAALRLADAACIRDLGL